MRLLSFSADGGLILNEFFGDEIPRYAILSHTWAQEREEVTFRDLDRDTWRSKQGLAGYRKILFCGEQARNHGLDYFWVDTACIDRSSSAELSEAINSMFRWYSAAVKCFVYLADVSIDNVQSTFVQSRWFTRGWTLQELLAAKDAEFFSKELRHLGDKSSLQSQIHEVTRIPIHVLQGTGLSAVPVEERLTWAQHRKTKREEDEAYCLLGILDLSMPLIYGEGKVQAFRRLHGLLKDSKKDVLPSNIQRWLSPVNARDDLLSHDVPGIEKSCAWILATSECQEFANMKRSGSLRIGGDPGSGKSTLAAFMVRSLGRLSNVHVLYFFCNGTDAKRQKPVQVLRTLLSQLLVNDESLYSAFEHPYASSGWETVESLADCQEFFRLALMKTRKPLHIIVDALDECHDGARLISFLTQSLDISETSLKLTITCRNQPELLAAFHEKPFEILTTSAQTDRHIRAYVRNRVLENKYIAHTLLGDEVFAKVTSAADGSWLYARLVMDEIRRLPGPASVQRQLRSIPTGLKGVYLQIFANMEHSMSPLELRITQQVLLWIDMKNFVEVGEDGLNRTVLDLVLQAEMSGEVVFDSLALVRQLCSPLITLSDEDDTDIKVYFFHHTAAQFLRECSSQLSSTLPAVLKPQTIKGLYRGSVGVWYFTHSPKATSNLQRLRSIALKHAHQLYIMGNTSEYFAMTYGLWAAFWFEAQPDIYHPEQLQELDRLSTMLEDFLSSKHVLTWIEMAMIINYHGGYLNLFDNIQNTIAIATVGETSPLSSIRAFSAAKRRFFSDYAYVVSITGPSYGSVPKPTNFEARPMAVRLLELGRKWMHLQNRYPVSNSSVHDSSLGNIVHHFLQRSE